MTLYSTIPIQIYFTQSIKIPFERSVLILSGEASKIEKTKALLALGRIVKAASKLPEPTKENTDYPNTHVIIDARDWYFSHFYHEPERAKVMRAIFNFVIILYQFDEPWRLKIDKVFEFIKSQPWKLPEYLEKAEGAWRWYREDDSKPFPESWIDYDPTTIGKV